MSSAERPLGFWRHVPWTFVVGLIVAGVLVTLIADHYGTYGAAVLIVYASVIGESFRTSRADERQRRADGDEHPARAFRTSVGEVLFAFALLLICVGLVVLVSYMGGDDGRVPTPLEGALGGAAVVVGLGIGLGVFLRAKRVLARRAAG